MKQSRKREKDAFIHNQNQRKHRKMQNIKIQAPPKRWSLRKHARNVKSFPQFGLKFCLRDGNEYK